MLPTPLECSYLPKMNNVFMFSPDVNQMVDIYTSCCDMEMIVYLGHMVLKEESS